MLLAYHRTVRPPAHPECHSPVVLDAYGQLSAALDGLIARANPVEALPGHEDESLLSRMCVVLAMYDAVARGAPVDTSPLAGRHDATAEQQLALVDDRWVDDVIMLTLAYATSGIPDDLQDRERVIGNPAFAGSVDVGGAFGDLLLGDTLIEIKTTKRSSPLNEWLYQAIAYVLLDYDNAYGIEKVAFYISRVPALIVWNVDDLLVRCGSTVDRQALADELRATARAA